MTRIAILPLALLVSGCAMGPKVRTYSPAHTPAGLELTVQSGRDAVTGELLAVLDTALLLVIHRPDPDSSGMPRLARVPAPRTWSAKEKEHHRLLARYPQGVSPQLEARLATAYQVDSIPWLP